MSILLTTAIRYKGRYFAKQLDIAAQNPAAAQNVLLQTLLARHTNTRFGREHHFSQIQTPEEYRSAVPVRDYEGFRPYVRRIMHGEANVLVSEPIRMFNLTSGTTGQPKYIPVTSSSEQGGSRLMQQWLYRTLKDHPRFLSRAVVGIVSPEIEGYTPCGIPYGNLSGRIYQQIPAIVRQSYAIPYPVFALRDYDLRYWAIARFALAQQVSFLCTPNPSTLLRLAEVISTHKEALIRAIHDGILGISVAADLAAQLRPWLKPQPQRARELERIVVTTDVLRPQDCWPHLTLLGCWTGGSVGVQVRQLSADYGNVPVRDLGYMASEARITLPCQDNAPDGILDLLLNYYEFVPEACVDQPDPPVLQSHELDIGNRYSILLTTLGGLYRYHINDIVEVTGFYHKAPVLAFLRKGQDMSNLTGEKLHVNHVLLAVAQVQQRFNLSIGQYRMVPNVAEMRYHFYLELLEDKSDYWIQQQLMPALDEALCQVNCEYGQKRNSRRLHPLCLHLMHPGWAETVQRQAIAQGYRDVQYKWKILCHDLPLEDMSAIFNKTEREIPQSAELLGG